MRYAQAENISVMKLLVVIELKKKTIELKTDNLIKIKKQARKKTFQEKRPKYSRYTCCSKNMVPEEKSTKKTSETARKI
jgi:hypothetical protein